MSPNRAPEGVDLEAIRKRAATRRVFRSDVYELLAEIDRLRRAAPEWRTMESAPRDGTPILVRVPGFDAPIVTRPSGRTGWLYVGYDAPTHWMPLPAPPSTSDTGASNG